MMGRCPARVGVALAGLCGLVLLADGARAEHTLWQIDGATNRLFVLGSVHFLRESDYPLPAVFDRAYDEAEALYMELDMDDLDPLAVTVLLASRGQLEDGRTLRDVLGESVYRRAADQAAAIDIRLDMLGSLEPWYAAMTVLQLQLMKLGFDPSQGIEVHLTGRAARDGKPIHGLESFEQQIDVLDSLPEQVQRDLLMLTLEEAAEAGTQLDTLVAAWRAGRIEELAEEMQRGFESFPQLYERVIVQRNRRWIDTITGLLDDSQDYLIVVGALHLVGKDSVIELLAQRGVRARQL